MAKEKALCLDRRTVRLFCRKVRRSLSSPSLWRLQRCNSEAEPVRHVEKALNTIAGDPEPLGFY